MNHQNQEQRLRNILFNSLDAFIGVDHNGLITEWNQQAANIFGWNHDEAIGQSMDEMIIPEKFREAHRHGMQRF